ncbi:MAG: tannase/feruloyl esterase family alpha/beta hydrolase [Steroidobacteraceae bacterium]
MRPKLLMRAMALLRAMAWRRGIPLILLAPVMLASVVVAAGPVAAADCAALAKIALPHATITLAREVPAGAFRPARPFSLGGPGPSYGRLPAFCRVAAAVRPTQDSLIRFELWMPAAGWNGKFLAVGNGGYSGEIWYPALIEPLSRGYATASTDTGHEGPADDASFALGHPEKWVDFSFRAVHEMTRLSKTLIDAYYGGAPKHAYWDGCSSGGRQGLMEAQRYPDDYDGIIAGAPASAMTHLAAQQIGMLDAIYASPESLIPPEKVAALHAAVLKACDALDGVKDGVLEDPRRCHFDPAAIECHGADGPSCLTAAQVATARSLYAPLRDPQTHAVLFPGLMRGSEQGWATGVGPMKPKPSPLFTTMFRYVVFMNPEWDYRTMNFHADVVRSDHDEAAISNAVDPDLGAYFAHGGKLIQYHGWADPGIAPLSSVDYYRSVAKALGGVDRISDDYRLFMVPGMDHCRGGAATDQFDMISALESWVERHHEPARILASRVRHGRVDRTRPLCPFPQVAMYDGSGSTNEARNFSCKAR